MKSYQQQSNSFFSQSARLAALALVLTSSPGVAAEPVATPTQNILSELMNRQQQLQSELQQLRGMVEQQGYELDVLKRAQKDSYMDTDERIRALDALVRPSTNLPPEVSATSPATSAAPIDAAPTTPVAPALAPPSLQVPNAEDQARYDQGLKQLRAGQYQTAIKTFGQVIKTSPPSPNRPNALYWTGEAYVVLGDSKSALNAFTQVVQESPAHQKSADAQLKIGYIYYDQKNYARARETLNKVKAQFPGTQAATLAEQRLKRMQSEGV